jgi:hypothetical protein
VRCSPFVVIEWAESCKGFGPSYEEQDDFFAHYLEIIGERDADDFQRCLAFAPVFKREPKTRAERERREDFDTVCQSLIIDGPKTLLELSELLKLPKCRVRYCVEQLRARRMLIESPRKLLFLTIGAQQHEALERTARA